MAYKLDWDGGQLTADELDALIYSDFATFAQVMFDVVNPGRKLVWAKYLGPLFSFLEDVAHGRRKRVIIAIPPRFLKSFSVSAALPAYVLGCFPNQEVMNVSYSQDLSKGFARQTLAIMTSKLYRRVFGDILVSERQPLSELRTVQNGVRRATSIDGTATGHGADLLIFDDPQKAGETLSDTVRRATNAAFEHTFYSRGNDPGTKRIIIVMQRLHEDDFVGHVLGLGEHWDVLDLPAIAEEDQSIAYSSLAGPQVYYRKAGESLHPERVSLADWATMRRTVGEAVWATQYQQRPTPAGGGVVEIGWLKPYDDADLPKFDRVIQSWDTANTDGASSDWSVCTTWGVDGKHLYLLHIYRDRLKFPDLLKAVRRQAQLHDADTIWIEDHASGTQLIQQLRSENFGRARGVKPTRDKRSRMESQTALMENGFVHVPREAPWLAEYLHELAMFPNGRWDDQVDSTSQALEQINAWDSYRRAEAYFKSVLDPRLEERENWVLRGPPSTSLVYDHQGRESRRADDGFFYVTAELGGALLRQMRWERIS